MLRERLWARREAKAQAARALADREAQQALNDERDARRVEARAEHDAAAKEERAEAEAKAHLEERRGFAEVEHDLLERTAEASLERARLLAERRATEAVRRTTAVEARLAELDGLVGTRSRDLAERRPAVAAAYAGGGPGALAAAVVDALTAAARPSWLPHAYEATYRPDRRELRVTFELPRRSVVPAVARYEFIESRTAIVSVPRSADERDAVYDRTVAGAAIRVLASVFDLAPPELVDRVALGADGPPRGRTRAAAHEAAVTEAVATDDAAADDEAGPGGGPAVAQLVDVEATRSEAEGLALDSPGFDPVTALDTLASPPATYPS